MRSAFPTSLGQQRLWLIDRLEGAGAAYHVPVVVRISRRLDRERLRVALDGLIERHESLRTTFAADDHGDTVQIVHDTRPVPIHEVDLSAEPDAEAAWRSRAKAEVARPMDLERGPLIRATLYGLAEDAAVLLLTIHHIVFDGWSEGILIRDLALLYDQGPVTALAPLSVQFADYSEWERERPARETDPSLAYWQAQLNGAVPSRLLPDWLPDPARRFEGRQRTLQIEDALVRDVRDCARREHATTFLIGLAAFLAAVDRFTSRQDLMVATPVTGRDRSELQDVVGFFANTVLIRLQIDPQWKSEQLLGAVRAAVQDVFAHGPCPFERIVAALPDADARRSPIRLMFSVQQPVAVHEAAALGWRLCPFEIDTGTAKFELTVFLVDEPSGFRLVAEYNTAMFEAATIDAFLEACRCALERIARNTGQAVAQWTLVPDTEVARLARVPPDTGAGLRVDEQFDQQAARTPTATAVISGNQRLTYADLQSRADRLAVRIRSVCTTPSVVAVLTQRDASLVVGLLGVLKAGGAYLPIELAQPDGRIAAALEDADVRVAIGTAPPDREFGRALIWLDPAEPDQADAATARGDARTATDVAYVMFTSGSTGRPKGVAVEHRNIAQLVRDPGFVSLGPEDRVLHLAPSAFDASTFEIWAPLLNGAAVVIAPTTTPSFDELRDLIRSNGVTTLWLTSSFFNAVIDSAPDVLDPLRQLLTGGEALSVPHVRRALALLPRTRIINGYGPTETTTFATTYPLPDGVHDRWISVPIGFPLRETAVFVLDQYGNFAPRGAHGMLFIAGGGVARGYVNRPAETAAAFSAGVIPGAPGLRAYRTGDAVRWRADGALQFLGRFDGLVKIRGMRIELEDVEAAIRSHHGVRDAAVVVRGTAGLERLIAHVVPREPGKAVAGLEPYLASRLPDYMVPAAVVWADSLPRTSQGKLDRPSLPDATPADRVVVAPATPTEHLLAALWAEMLGIQPIGRDDNFFALGGHSLLAARMSFLVAQRFGADVPIERFYRDASLAAIATRIDEARAGQAAPPRIVRQPRRPGSGY
jgi:amino acid adenylation domain-containing protein